VLNLQGLSKQFFIHHLQREVPAFHNLNRLVKEGEFVLISGANGVGKSSLLRCLYRNYQPSSGQALYQSRYGTIDLASAAAVDILKLRREEISFVTQFLRPRPRVTALEWVAEPLLRSAPKARQKAAESLQLFGLKEALWQAYPSTFSGGEQQKVNLARALLKPGRLLLLDEPTASLDPAARLALVQQLSELKAAGITILGVFHHPEDVLDLIDTTLVLELPVGQERLSYEAR
jgi:alpha-D-ribose 1-methylphosphonate 5-triphosphate synthase subunit PhnL